MTLRELFGPDLRGRKLGVSWTYSPSTKKPIAPHHDFMYAASLFGPEIVFAHPPELRIDPEIEAAIQSSVEVNGGSYTVVDSMEEAAENADILYAKNYVCLDLLSRANHNMMRWRSCSANIRAGSRMRNG